MTFRFSHRNRRSINTKRLLQKYHLEKIRLNLSVIGTDIILKDADANAAWELYVEMLTRIVTQPLPAEHGDEQAALDSVYRLFSITREILRRHGKDTVQFSKVAVPVLNQVVRPFTAKWHRESLAGGFADPRTRKEFRQQLIVLRRDLRNYNRLLAEIAGVEDLTDLESDAGDRVD